jgi:putative hydrolase of the HAD superfamily
VADGRPGTYANVLAQHGVLDLFDLMTISEQLGCEKPDARMFTTTMDRLGLSPADYSRVLMVGNNLERDIKGANLAGLTSVWIDWAPRRSKIPAEPAEVPHYTIRLPQDLLAIIDELERTSP